jgi:hypothetical protein
MFHNAKGSGAINVLPRPQALPTKHAQNASIAVCKTLFNLPTAVCT